MKTRNTIIISMLLAFAFFGAGQVFGWEHPQPPPPEKGDTIKIDIDNKNIATGIGIGGEGGKAIIKDSGNSSITGSGNSNVKANISNKIQVPRNFSELPSGVQMQFAPTMGALYFKSSMDNEETRLLNKMLGSIPPPKIGLSRKTIQKNAIPKHSFGVKSFLNELPLLELFVKGEKGMANYKSTGLIILEEDPPSKPAEKMNFVRKLEDGEELQIVDRSELEASGWIVAAEFPMNGVSDVDLPSLKWSGYSTLVNAGYEYGAVAFVSRSNVQKSSGKNFEAGGAGNFLTGSVEQSALNALLKAGKGSGESYESQQFYLIVAGLKEAKPGAPFLIKPPAPPIAEEPRAEAKPEAPKPQAEEPHKIELNLNITVPPAAPPAPALVPAPKEIVKEKIVEVPVEVNPFQNIPEIPPIYFELNSAVIKDFTVDGVKFENQKALEDAKAKLREKVLPLLQKYPNLKLYFIGVTCNYGPVGTFHTKTKEGKRFSNNEAYNNPLGKARAQALSLEIVQALGISPERTEMLSKGIGHPDVKLNELERTSFRSAYIMIGDSLETAISLSVK